MCDTQLVRTPVDSEGVCFVSVGLYCVDVLRCFFCSRYELHEALREAQVEIVDLSVH